METTTGLPASRAAASAERISSEAVTLPPGLLTRRIIARIAGSRRAADLGCGGITTYAARRRLTIDDRAAGKNNGDLTITSTLRFQGIVIDADMAVIARACIPAKLLDRMLSASLRDASPSTSRCSTAYCAISPPVACSPFSICPAPGKPAPA